MALLLVGAAFVALAYYGIKYLEVAKQDKVLAQVIAWAGILVKSVEQQMNLEGFKKKELVMLGLRKFCVLVKARLTDSQLEDILEAAVFSMNQLAQLTPGEADNVLIDKLTSGLGKG
jgi:hypothetical protein